LIQSNEYLKIIKIKERENSYKKIVIEYGVACGSAIGQFFLPLQLGK